MPPTQVQHDTTDLADSEFIRAYYDHQYDRMAKLEEQGASVTSIVVSLSVIAVTFGLGGAQAPNQIAAVGIPLLLLLANLFAILYLAQAGVWVRTHRLRAKEIMKRSYSNLYEFDQQTVAPHRTVFPWMGRREIQMTLHGILIALCLLLLGLAFV